MWIKGFVLSIVAAVLLLLVGMSIKEAYSREAGNDTRETCIITKEQILEQFKALHYGNPQPMPAKYLGGFIERFNAEPPFIGAAADNVIVLQNPDIPIVRIIFLHGDCFVNYYDAPIPTFMKLLKESAGQPI